MSILNPFLYTKLADIYILPHNLFIRILISSTTICTISLLVFLLKRYKRHQLFKNLGIPTPKTNLLDGNLNEYIKNPAHFEINAKWVKELGPLHGFYLGDMAILQVTHPRLVQQIFQENQTLPADRIQAMTKEINAGILFIKEPRWKTMRKTIQPTFSRFKIHGDDSSIQIEQTLTKMINYLEMKSEKHNMAPFEVDIVALMKSTTLNIVSVLAFNIIDRDVSETDIHVEEIEHFLARAKYDGITGWSIRLPILSRIIKFVLQYITMGPFLNNLMSHIEKKINHGLGEIIENKRSQDKNRHTLLDSMIEMHHNGQLTRLEVLGNVIGVLIAGYDTTSTTLSCLFWILAKYPDIQDRLRKELIEYGTDSVWFESLIHETMRLYPVAVSFTSRIFQQDLELDVTGILDSNKTKLTIPKGVVFIYNAWVSNRDPNNWENPNDLNPERFIDPKTEKMNKKLVASLAAFGFGRHICLGQNLAYLEIKSIVTKIILLYKIRLISPDELKLVSSAKVLSKPKDKIRLHFESLYNQ